MMTFLELNQPPIFNSDRMLEGGNPTMARANVKIVYYLMIVWPGLMSKYTIVFLHKSNLVHKASQD